MNSIRHRLQIAMFAAGLLPLIVVVFTTHTVLSRAVLRSERATLTDAAHHLARHVTEVMDRSARDLDSLRTNPLLTDPASELPVKLREMRRLVEVYEAFCSPRTVT